MSQFSFPFTANVAGDDGPYSAAFFADIVASLFYQNPTSRNDASVIFGSGDGSNDALAVTETTPASNSIEVQIGKALVQGYFYYNDAPLEIEVTPNVDGSGFDRIDTVVLEIDFVNQTVRADIVTGTPAAVPVPPTLTKTSSLYQVPMADIDVQNLFVTITDSEIDNSVKVQYTLWDARIGGTGLDTISLGEMLMASADDTYLPIPAVSDFSTLIGDTAKTPRARFVSMRPHIIGGTSAVATIGTAASGTVLPIASPAILNPDSWITNISGNQFFLSSGYYLVWAVASLINTSGAAAQAVMWIHNATTTTNVAQGTTVDFSGTANVGQNAIILPHIIQSNGTDAFELRAMRGGGGAGFGASNVTLTPSPTGSYASVPRMIHIRKLKI